MKRKFSLKIVSSLFFFFSFINDSFSQIDLENHTINSSKSSKDSLGVLGMVITFDKIMGKPGDPNRFKKVAVKNAFNSS